MALSTWTSTSTLPASAGLLHPPDAAAAGASGLTLMRDPLSSQTVAPRCETAVPVKAASRLLRCAPRAVSKPCARGRDQAASAQLSSRSPWSNSQRTRRRTAATAWLGRCCPTATRWSRRVRTNSPGRLTHAERLPTHGEHLQANDAGNRRSLSLIGTRPPARGSQHASLPHPRTTRRVISWPGRRSGFCSGPTTKRSSSTDLVAAGATMQKPT